MNKKFFILLLTYTLGYFINFDGVIICCLTLFSYTCIRFLALIEVILKYERHS